MYKRQIVFLWFVVIGMLILRWYGLISDSEVQKAELVNVTYKNLSNLTRSYKERVQSTLEDGDNLLLLTKASYQSTGQISKDIIETFGSVKSKSIYDNISIINREGLLEASSTNEQIGSSMEQKEYFSYHKQKNSNEIHIDKPLSDNMTGKWTFAISRRMNNPNGSFAGVVVAVGNTNHFTDF